MSANERDTHFQGFAELLQVDLAALNSRQWSLLDEYIYAKKQLIAQRAYDLVYFLINEAPTDYSSFNAGYGTPDEIAA